MPENDPPAPLLLEQRIETGPDEFVRRVCTDGAVWSRSHLRARDADGWPAEGGRPEWELEARLPPDALAQLRAAIERSGFFELPGDQRPDVNVIGGSVHVWTAELDGRRHVTTLHGVPGVESAPVTQVADALEDALAAAGA
jgi:hypothetical protein